MFEYSDGSCGTVMWNYTHSNKEKCSVFVTLVKSIWNRVDYQLSEKKKEKKSQNTQEIEENTF